MVADGADFPRCERRCAYPHDSSVLVASSVGATTCCHGVSRVWLLSRLENFRHYSERELLRPCGACASRFYWSLSVCGCTGCSDVGPRVLSEDHTSRLTTNRLGEFRFRAAPPSLVSVLVLKTHELRSIRILLIVVRVLYTVLVRDFSTGFCSGCGTALEI